MVRAKKPAAKKQEFLSPSERQGLEEEKRELELTLAETNDYGSGGKEQTDTTRLRGEIQRLNTAIAERTPGQVRGANKDKLVKEEGEIEAKLQEGMPSWYEMRQPTKNPGAVRKHMEWCTRNKHLINRYRDIQRILRPMEPKSVESLRKEK